MIEEKLEEPATKANPIPSPPIPVATNRQKFDEKKISIKVEKLKDHRIVGVIGDDDTYIALKNSTTYLIVTDYGEAKLVDNGKEYPSVDLPNDDESIKDIIYVDHLDCFFLLHANRLYRKDLDAKPPYLWMDIKIGYREGASLIYSQYNKRLFTIKDLDNLAVIHLERKRIDLELIKVFALSHNDFRVFGEKENKVVSILKNGVIVLYVINYDLRKVIACHRCSTDKILRRGEAGISIAVGDRSQYIFVEMRGYRSAFIYSRLLVYKVDGHILKKKAVLDLFDQGIYCSYPLECLGYVGTHILWVGLSHFHGGIAQIFDYDTESGQLRELEEKRVSHNEYCPFNIHRLGKGNELFYTGQCGRVMKLTFNY